MKNLWIILLSVFSLGLLIWINLPGEIPIKYLIGQQEYENVIRRPVIAIPTDQGVFYRDFELKLGLDLQGGTSLTYEADTSELSPGDVVPAMESARDIIERRVNMFGVSEPSVRTLQSGDIYRIAVDLPGIEDSGEAIGLIGTTAQLTFREESEATDEAEIATMAALFPPLEKKTGLTGGEVRKAEVTFDPNSGEPTVLIQFSNQGTQQFADISRRNVGKPVGIFLDDQLISAPIIQQPILDGNAVISGDFTTETAKQLAVAINAGALPVPVELVNQQDVGPTLGAEEVQKSLEAGIIGLILVMLFMVIYYGRLGVVACIALLIYGLLSMTVFRAIPIVLTLPGVAGFILSIGMAVDANILIFERIKEEQRKGRELSSAIRLGFGRAIDAIKDANITTLLVAFILFNPLDWSFFPTFGLVRGFALTLAIGVIMSLFTGVFITRHLIPLVYRKAKV